MGSDANKINDGTSFQPSEPSLCANGCGFFGTASTMNLCSKCYRDLRTTEEQAASAKAAMEKLVFSVDSSSPVVGSSSSAAVETVEVELSALVVDPSVVESAAKTETKAANRCWSCKKKVGVLGFKCRCGDTFCGDHRYPEKHECSFDFKALGRDSIAKANPVVKSDKIERF